MFLIMGTFAIVVFMLLIGFIGEVLSELFTSSESEEIQSEKSFTEYAPAV
jgi:uncharacterized membrane protein